MAAFGQQSGPGEFDDDGVLGGDAAVGGGGGHYRGGVIDSGTGEQAKGMLAEPEQVTEGGKVSTAAMLNAKMVEIAKATAMLSAAMIGVIAGMAEAPQIPVPTPISVITGGGDAQLTTEQAGQDKADHQGAEHDRKGAEADLQDLRQGELGAKHDYGQLQQESAGGSNAGLQPTTGPVNESGQQPQAETEDRSANQRHKVTKQGAHSGAPRGCWRWWGLGKDLEHGTAE